MKNETILKKAIEKAVKNGYNPTSYNKIDKIEYSEKWNAIQLIKYHKSKRHISSAREILVDDPLDCLFDSEFAKAFFPKPESQPRCNCGAELGEEHRKTCASMICIHCGVNIWIVGDKKVRDHVHYPEGCDKCLGLTLNWQQHQHKMLNEIQEGRCPIKYLEKFL